jgi:surfactin synthase thioesterase subunit
VKVFGRPGETAVFTDPELWPRFEALSKGSPTWRNEFTPRFYLALPRYRSGMAERVRMPLLVCVADGDVYANPKFQAWVAEQAPRGEVRHYAGEHFDLYHGLMDRVVDDQIEFLRRSFAAVPTRR